MIVGALAVNSQLDLVLGIEVEVNVFYVVWEN
jgi:hypothetical protein